MNALWEMTLNRPSASATVSDPTTLPPKLLGLSASKFVGWHRVGLILTGLGLMAGLVVARMLVPDASGMGTHRQLGFGQCSFMSWFGMPCPSCGMTTSWAHLVRGQWRESIACNAGGFLFGCLAIFCGPWLMVSGIRGRWVYPAVGFPTLLVLAVLTFFAVFGQWLARLMSS